MKLKSVVAELKKEIQGHKIIYLILVIVLVGGMFVRVYRIDKVLGFYFDQGRDALVIWDFLFGSHKPYLIGPTTGIAGIFRGPYYYYLITPFYLLSRGSPILPSIFLSFTSMVAVVFVYYLGYKAVDRWAGLIAAIIASFSFYIVMAGRWLSNPTPMLLLSMLLVFGMLKVTEGKKWGWPLIALVSGLSLFNFGSAGEVFYFPAIFIFFLWQWKNRPNRKYFIWSVILFVLTFLPMVLFDLKHDGILRNNIDKFLFGERSFGAPTWKFVWDKFYFYYDVFTNKIFDGRYEFEKILFFVIAGGFFYQLHKLLKNNVVKILLLLLVSVCLGLIFFQGNFGNIYDYYLTGYYLIFILLFSFSLAYLWRSLVGKVFVIYFLYLFLNSNIGILQNRLSDNCDGVNSICLSNQIEAVDFVYRDAASFAGKDAKLNVDTYVPPVIPYAYDYLFLWRGTRFFGKTPELNQISLLYTFYEVDSPHPERLDAWLARQKGIGKVEETKVFGGITVERRTRIK